MNVLTSSLSACLVDSGVLLAMIEEEKLSRKKDKVCYGKSGAWCANVAERIGEKAILPDSVKDDGKSGHDPHHLYHAVAAYMQSGLNDASILVMDGTDEGFVYSTGIFTAKNGEIEEVIRYGTERSLGHLYDTTAAYCGLVINHDAWLGSASGKVMGLATFCNEDFCDEVDYLSVHPYTGAVADTSITLLDLPRIFEQKLGLKRAEKFSFDYALAAGYAQYLFEKSVGSLLRFMKNTLPSKNLIISGGCGLNCTMNGKILRSGEWDNLFIPPMCSDSGNLLGKAYLLGFIKEIKPMVYNTIHHGLPKNRPYTKMTEERVASYIRGGKVVAWFEGGSEYGPRALGHRSLLADPSLPWMAYRLNEIKDREYWRPFAPVILDTYFFEVFDVGCRMCEIHKYMLATELVKHKLRQKYSTIVAPDGSSRPQVLTKAKENATLYSFMENNNLPILVNTSLNGKNEPICENIEEACNFAHQKGVILILASGGSLYEVDTSPVGPTQLHLNT